MDKFCDKYQEIYSNVISYLAEEKFLKSSIRFNNIDIECKYETVFLGLHLNENIQWMFI